MQGFSVSIARSMDDCTQEVGRRLRTLRKKHGLTLQEFAEMADFNQNFVQQIEAGKKKEIWLSTVVRIAAAFELEIHEFLASDLPEETGLSRKVASSRVHRK